MTIIEVFAWMTDQLIHRLNQVPDRLYLKFLDLLGVELTPAIAARPRSRSGSRRRRHRTCVVDRGAQAATLRTETEPPVVFTVTEDLDIVPSSVVELLSTIQEGTYRSHAETLQFEQAFTCFDQVPKPGDALIVGLSTPSRRAPSRFGSRATSPAGRAWTRATRRWSGKRWPVGRLGAVRSR